MERIQLPATDLSLSRLIYGMWRLADDKDTSTSHVQAKIEACLKNGITSFDQADIYGNYECEKLLGKTLNESPSLRDQMEIITKCDIALLSDKRPEHRVKHYDTSAAHIRSSVEASLTHMAIDRIDVLLLHRPDPLMDHHETGAVLDALIKEGKVRTVGVSNFMRSDWELLQSAMSAKLVTNQIELSVARFEAFLDGQVAFLQKEGIPPMAWSPLGGGQLMNPSHPKEQALFDALSELGAQHGCTADHIAIAWLLKHPSRILPVMGTNNLDRIEKLHLACSVELSRQDWFALLELAKGEEVP